MAWSDTDALGVGESSQGMDANPTGSGLGSDEFGRIFGSRPMSRAAIAYARNRALMRGRPALSGGLSVAMQEAYARGYNPWSGEPMSGPEIAALRGTMGKGGLSQHYGPLSGKLGLQHAAHLANISTQKSPFNQQLENFAQVIGKTAQTLNAQDMQAFDAAVRSGTSDAGPLGTAGQGGVSQNYGNLSGVLGPTIGLNTNAAALAAVNKQRAHLANITTQKSTFNQELENFARARGKTGQTLNTQDMQAYDKAVRAGQSFATAPGINYGSYDDEGMPAWGGFGYMDPTQGPGAPNNLGYNAGEFASGNFGYNAGEFAGNNLGWDAGEFGTAPPGGYNMSGDIDGGSDPRRWWDEYYHGGDHGQELYNPIMRPPSLVTNPGMPRPLDPSRPKDFPMHGTPYVRKQRPLAYENAYQNAFIGGDDM